MNFKDYSKVVVFDTETTGLYPERGCQIIELAYVSVSETQTKERDLYISLNNTGDKLPDKIVELTGITDDYLSENGKSEQEVIEEFVNELTDPNGKVLLIAYNAQFDLNFLRAAYLRVSGKDLAEKIGVAFDCIDSLTLCKEIKEYPHRLENCIEHYSLQDQYQNSHNALDDTRATLAVTKRMLMELDYREYINVFGYKRKYGVNGTKLKGISYIAQY